MLAALGVLVFVLTYFQPQDLFINHTVNEALPLPLVTASSTTPGGLASATPATPASRIIGEGLFRSGEHKTTGVAQLISVPGHGTLVRLSSFRTSNGPAVHVWLSAASPGANDATVAAAPHLDLGGLKGNIGNQNYSVPAGAESAPYPTVVIWCQRFSVTFGYAGLR